MSTLWRLAIGLIVVSVVTSVSFVFLPARINFARPAENWTAESLQLRELFKDGGKWLNSQPLKVDDLDGKIVLLAFFRFSEDGDNEMLTQLTEWNQLYENQGLAVVGVHVPKWSFERDSRYVNDNIGALGLNFPVVQDLGALAKNYNVKSGQSWLLFNRNGEHVADMNGRFVAQEVEGMVKDLVAGKPSFIPRLKAAAPKERIEKLTLLAAGDGAMIKQIKEEDANEIDENVISYYGEWKQGEEALIGDENESFVAIKTGSVEMKALLAPADDETMRVNITIDGKPIPKDVAGEYVTYDSRGQSFLQIHEPKLYTIFDSFDREEHVVRIYPISASLAVYSVSLDN